MRKPVQDHGLCVCVCVWLASGHSNSKDSSFPQDHLVPLSRLSGHHCGGSIRTGCEVKGAPLSGAPLTWSAVRAGPAWTLEPKGEARNTKGPSYSAKKPCLVNVLMKHTILFPDFVSPTRMWNRFCHTIRFLPTFRIKATHKRQTRRYWARWAAAF